MFKLQMRCNWYQGQYCKSSETFKRQAFKPPVEALK